MMRGPLSWSAQVASHQAYVDQHRADPVPPTRAAPERVHRVKRTTAAAAQKREALLHALCDRQPHPFRDLRAVLPDLSCQGIYYLVDALGAEGLITVTVLTRTNRTYQLA